MTEACFYFFVLPPENMTDNSVYNAVELNTAFGA